jgi:predicted hydrocarbon binding protein
MHGIIFSALKKYVRTKLGDEAWTNLRTAAGVGDRIYLPVQTYPDTEIDSLIDTVATLSGITIPQLLEDFGRSMVPDFLKVYRPLIEPDWKTLDLLEHVETKLHSAARHTNPGANPPELRIRRESADRVVIDYDSPRRWCALGRGLILGVADHYGERVHIEEPSCQLRGQETCQIAVTKP